MRYELKSIAVWSVVKMSFFLNLILGGILGFFYSLFFGFFIQLMGQSPFMSQYQYEPSEMSLFPLMIFFTIGGAIAGAFFHTVLVALIVGLYNLIVKMTGGVVLNLNALDQPETKSIPVVVATATTTPPVSAPKPAVAPPPPPPPPPEVEREQSLREIREQTVTPAAPVPSKEPEVTPPSVETPSPETPKPEQPKPETNRPTEPDEKQDDDPETPLTW